MFEPRQLLARVEQETATLLAAAGPLDAPVPSCPEWTVADLLGHVGAIHRWAARIVEERLTEPMWDRETPPDHADRAGWVRDGAQRLIDVLGPADPGAPVWGWAGDGTVGFWHRRMAHETLVHRMDAELASGREIGPVPADVAVDAVDEVLATLIASPWMRPLLAGDGQTLHLHASDADGGEWTLTFASDGVEVESGHAKADAALAGPAERLVAWVWRRGGTEGLTVHGDTAVLDVWEASFPL